MMTYNQKDIWQGRSFETYGEFSESECEIFKQFVKPGDVVMDIGANVGSHTLCFARLVTKTGIVAAFEPERTAFYTLCGNVAANNLRHVFCFQQALGEQSGLIAVPELDYATTENWGGIELEKDHSASPHYNVPMNIVDLVTVPKVNFMKIDVEGMEARVLQGATKTIEKFKPVLYMENDRPEKQADLIKLVDSLGYDMWMHEAWFFNPNNFYGEPVNIIGNVISGNMLCLPKGTEFTPKDIPQYSTFKKVPKPVSPNEVDLEDIGNLPLVK
jgi:FkbM family methyltransferase